MSAISKIVTEQPIDDCTPTEFGVMLETFTTQLLSEYGESIFYVLGGLTDPDENPVRVFFTIPEGGRKDGYITAQREPRNKTRLFVYAQDEHWPSLKRSWELLLDELIRQEWIDPRQPTATGVDGVAEAGEQSSTDDSLLDIIPSARDRKMVGLSNERYTAPEIVEELVKSRFTRIKAGTVAKRIVNLRSKYGAEVVHYKQKGY